VQERTHRSHAWTAGGADQWDRHVHFLVPLLRFSGRSLWSLDAWVNPIYKSTGYYLRAIPEDSRDLVICPVQHTTNTVLACSEPFWKCVILTLAGFVTLAQPPQPSPGTICEGIALNFGIWETENAREVSKGVVQFAVDCHGHAHILLSPNGFAELERIPDFKCLRGRFRHPDSHLRNDCSDLQTERLLADENSLLRSDVGALSDM